MKDISNLISKLQNGNLAAFDEIYDLTSKSIFFVAYSVLKNKEDSEEVVQEVFVKFFKIIKTFDKTKNTYNWLYTVAKNEAINKWKQKKKTVQLDFAENISDDKINLYDDLQSQNLLEMASQILTAEEYEILSLCLLKGFKRREVSQMIGKPIPTVTWIYNNALKKLEKHLKGGNNEKD